MTPYRTLVFAIASDHIQHAATFKNAVDTLQAGTSAAIDLAVGTKALPLPKVGSAYELKSGLDDRWWAFQRIATYALAAEIEAANSYLSLLNGTAGLLNSGTVATSMLGLKNSIDVSRPRLAGRRPTA